MEADGICEGMGVSVSVCGGKFVRVAGMGVAEAALGEVVG
jgi:hypothetical protein